MTEKEIIRAFTGLQGARFVVGDLKISGDSWLWKIVPDERGRLCGCCGKEAPGYDRDWIYLRDIPLGVSARCVTWKVRRSRVNCPTCGIVVEKLPFRGRFGQLTKRCEDWVIELLFSNQITVKDVSRIFLLNYHTVYRIDLEVLRERVTKLAKPNPRHISVDEKSFQKGQSYVTIVTDADTSKVIWVEEGRRKESLDRFFEWLGKRRTSEIETIAMDLHESYHLSAREHAPKAEIVPDKFHVVQRLNQAIDESFKEITAHHPTLTARRGMGKNELRWLTRRKVVNQSEKQLVQLSRLKRINERLYEAYILKDHFFEFFEFRPTALDRAKTFLINWAVEAWKTGLKALQDLASYIQRNANLLLGIVKHQRTSAVSEGLNTKISVIKRMAYGYRNLEYFMLKIMQRCGLLGNPCTH